MSKKDKITEVCHDCLNNLPFKVLKKTLIGKMVPHFVYLCKTCIKRRNK